MDENHVEVCDLMRDDLIRAELLWSRAEFIDDFMAYEIEEEDEDGYLVSAVQHCEAYVSGGLSGGSHSGIIKCFGIISSFFPCDKNGALAMVSDLLLFFGSLAEFVERNGDRFDVDGYCPEDALKIINEIIFYLERVRGNLKMLLMR